MTLSPEAAALQRRLQYDTAFWARHCAKIVDKRKQLVPLVARPWQVEFDEALEKQRAAGQPMRAIVLKARKLGFSTWVVAKFMQRLTQFQYQSAITCAQDVKTAGVLFDIADIIYQHLPEEHELGMGFNIRPELTGASFSPSGRKFMQFGERSRQLRKRSTQSILEIDTAQTPEAGRGYTPSLIHGSEVAKWPGGDSTGSKLLSLMNAVPDEPETIVVLESTANGFNHFQKRWQRAVEGSNDPLTGDLFVPVFAAWHRDPDCAAVFASEEDRERFVASIGEGEYGEDEPMLIERFACTPEQLLWRRRTIREKCGDSIEQFKQEYPASPEEAFIGSGNSVFGTILVSRAIAAAEKAPEPVKGWLRGDAWVTKQTRGGTVEVPQTALWVPQTAVQSLAPAEKPAMGAPLLEVWEHPFRSVADLQSQYATGAISETQLEGELERSLEREPGCYIVTVDVAGDPVASGKDGDFHAIQVIDHISKQQVAAWRGRVDHADLRLLALLVALYYNEAYLAVEVTGGPGLSVAVPLQQDYRYKFMHRRREVDTRTQRETQKVGWDTNRATKPLIEGAMLDAFKDGTHGIRQMATALEFNTYVIDEKGEHGARDGEHDDLCMAWMIAQYLSTQLRPKRRKHAKTGRVRGFDPLDSDLGY